MSASQATGTPVLHPPRSRLRRRGRAAIRVVDSLSVAILLLVAWQLWISVGHAPQYEMPSPRSVVHSMWTDHRFLLHSAWVTLQEVLLGFLIAVGVGVPLAVVIASFRRIEKIVFPIVVASQVVPKIAIAPLFLIWMGFGLGSKIVIAFMIAVFPIVIETVAGLRSLPVEMTHLARATGAGRLAMFLTIRFPNALPSIFVGLRIAIVFAVTGAIVGEFAGADQGLGHAIISDSAVADTPSMFAAIAYITLLGCAAFGVIVLLERIAVPWRRSRLG
jgi:NitT/TauT family transport system permease protein